MSASQGPIDRRQALLRLADVARAGTVSFTFWASHHARAAAIVAVRVWPAEEYTRVTLESDEPLTTSQAVLSDPPRFSIDIEGLDLTDPLKELVSKVRADDPFIAGVRIGQNRPKVVRLVLDLKQSAEPQVFTLQPVAAYRHRLVFDLYPAVPVDPLLAMVREKEQAERKAAAAVRDALGDWISGKEDAKAPTAPPPASRAPAAPSPQVALPTPRANGPAPGPTADQKNKIDRLIVVALDPGHGGEDPGAIGPTGLREKDVVLAVALQLRDKINGNPTMRAFLTRDADYFVPLQDRVRKARRVQADLLVSIHADAFTESSARGASVFALSDGVASSQSARWLADKENAADAIGGVNIKLKKDAQVMRTILDMSTSAQIKDSLKLGSEVLGQLDRVGRLHKPRVEQARFAVLRAPDVPSILVETAFISNPDEEAKLRRADYQARLVDALHNGIKRYFAKNPPLARNRSA